MKELSPLREERIKLERFPKALLVHKPSREQSSSYSLPATFDFRSQNSLFVFMIRSAYF